MAKPDDPDVPFEVKHSEKFGRYLIAKRDLPAGEIVFREVPLFVYSQFEDTVESDTFTCISCYRVVKKSLEIKCTICSWPFCSFDCSKDLCHCQLECELFLKNYVTPTADSFGFLFLIRYILLKDEDRTKWDKLANLTATANSETPAYIRLLARSSMAAQKFLRNSCGITVSRKYIKEIFNRFKINAFSFSESDVDNKESPKQWSAVYEITCMISNSCAPNLSWFLAGESEGNDRWSIGLYSREAIKTGEMATISYSEDYLSLGTRERRIEILNRLSFLCQCSRCLDPTELDICYSSLKCPKCCVGYVHPPTGSTNVDRYSCENCNYLMPPARVLKMETDFSQKMEDISGMDAAYRRKFFDVLISEASCEHQLHRNHRLVNEATWRWIYSLNFNALLPNTNESFMLFQKINGRANKLLAVCRKFGSLSQQLTLEGTIAMALIRFYFKSKDYVTIVEDKLARQDKLYIVTKIVHGLGEGIHLAIPQLLDAHAFRLARDMQEKHAIWSKRLSKYIVLTLMENESLDEPTEEKVPLKVQLQVDTESLKNENYLIPH